MHPYGIELFIQERQQELLREVEQQRIWEASRRAGDDSPASSYRSRLKIVGALRRFVQMAWAW